MASRNSCKVRMEEVANSTDTACFRALFREGTAVSDCSKESLRPTRCWPEVSQEIELPIVFLDLGKAQSSPRKISKVFQDGKFFGPKNLLQHLCKKLTTKNRI